MSQLGCNEIVWYDYPRLVIASYLWRSEPSQPNRRAAAVKRCGPARPQLAAELPDDRHTDLGRLASPGGLHFGSGRNT